jgi:hypothetical protein
LKYKAYVKCDLREDAAAINDLRVRLNRQSILLHSTTKEWDQIQTFDSKPFLYFRNPYIRIENEYSLLEYHQGQKFPYIKIYNDDYVGNIISVKDSDPSNFSFNVKQSISFYEPPIEALPILLANYRRPTYLKLTLNSILHNLEQCKDQKIYIVSSDPDKDTLEILENLPENVEIVVTENNVGRAITNFGSKFFNLEKFIHFETDGILSEATSYLLPYWTRQFNYRSTTADLVGFRVSNENKPAAHYPAFFDRKELVFSNNTWNYFVPKLDDLPPISGLGLVIDSNKMYQNFNKDFYYKNDWNLYFEAKLVCIANIPVYHLGNNQAMDYKKRDASPTDVARFQKGTNLRTGEEKIIDLESNFNNDKLHTK